MKMDDLSANQHEGFDAITAWMEAIGEAVAELHELKADDDVRLYFLRRLDHHIAQRRPALSENSQKSLDKFYESVCGTIHLHIRQHPEIHNPIRRAAH